MLFILPFVVEGFQPEVKILIHLSLDLLHRLMHDIFILFLSLMGIFSLVFIRGDRVVKASFVFRFGSFRLGYFRFGYIRFLLFSRHDGCFILRFLVNLIRLNCLGFFSFLFFGFSALRERKFIHDFALKFRLQTFLDLLGI